MNVEEKRRITQNLSSLKEYMSDLDPVIDILIENDVFKLEHRDQIEQTGTHQKQFNEFIRILTSSPNKDAYQTFLDALHTEKYYTLAEKIQSTPVITYQRSISSSSTSVACPEDYTKPDIGAGASGNTGASVSNYTSLVKDLLNGFGKRQEELIMNFEKQQREERREFEKRRLEDKREMENILREEKIDAERKRKQDKQENSEKMEQMWKEWQVEKQEILKRNENMIEKLHRQIDDIHHSDMEYKCLQEKYDYLKEVQQKMRENDNDRVERLRQKTKEKEVLQRENMSLKTEMQEMMERFERLREEKWEIDCIVAEKEKIEKELREKERENLDLKSRIVEQYNMIQEILQEQKNSSKVDDPGYVRSVENQIQQVTDVYSTMDSSHDGKSKAKTVKPRNLNPVIPTVYKKPRRPIPTGWKC